MSSKKEHRANKQVSVLATSTLLIEAKKKAVENIETNKTGENIENGKNSDYLGTNLV